MIMMSLESSGRLVIVEAHSCSYIRSPWGLNSTWWNMGPRVDELFGDWILRTCVGFGDCSGEATRGARCYAA